MAFSRIQRLPSWEWLSCLSFNATPSCSRAFPSQKLSSALSSTTFSARSISSALVLFDSNSPAAHRGIHRYGHDSRSNRLRNDRFWCEVLSHLHINLFSLVVFDSLGITMPSPFARLFLFFSRADDFFLICFFPYFPNPESL